MQKRNLLTYLIVSSLAFLALWCFPSLLHAQGSVPVLPPDASVRSGRLPGGVGYAIASQKSLKGTADFVLLQRMCQNVEKIEFRDVPVYRGQELCDSVLRRIFGIMAASIEDDPDEYGTDNQYIVISGDVNAAAVADSLSALAARLPHTDVSHPAPDYIWNGPYPPEWNSRKCPDGSVELTSTFRRRRMDASLMHTVVPVVSMRMDRILDIIVEKSLAATFEHSSLPYSGLSFTQSRAWNGFGDAVYTFSVKVNPGDGERARRLAEGVFRSLRDNGVPHTSYVSARSEVMSEFMKTVNYPVSNEANELRCSSHLLYGSLLATPASVYDFFAGKEVPDSSQLRSMNRFAKEVFALTPACDSIQEAVRIVNVNKADTMFFPKPSKKKVKPLKTAQDFITGGTFWTFDNGLNVIYRQMPTKGTLYYSMVFNCGASDFRDAAPGESAFYADLFRCAPVGSRSGYDFQRLHEACGITMNCNVGLYDMSLFGEASSSDLHLLLRTLLQAMNERGDDPAAYAYAGECSLLSLTEADRDLEELYNALHPDYRYTPYRVREGITPDLARHSGELFEKAFSRCDDAVLVLIGDRPAADVLRHLRHFVYSFRTGKGVKPMRTVAFTTVSGTVRREMVGERGIYMELSAPMTYTADNYFAAGVLEEALTRLLSGYAAKVDVALNPRPSEHIDLRISAKGDVDEDGLLSALRLLAKDDAVYESLADWRTITANRDAAARLYPDYWMKAARTRFTDSKDIATKSGDKIKAVKAEKLKELSQALLYGARAVLTSAPAADSPVE